MLGNTNIWCSQRGNISRITSWKQTNKKGIAAMTENGTTGGIICTYVHMIGISAAITSGKSNMVGSVYPLTTPFHP